MFLSRLLGLGLCVTVMQHWYAIREKYMNKKEKGAQHLARHHSEASGTMAKAGFVQYHSCVLHLFALLRPRLSFTQSKHGYSSLRALNRQMYLYPPRLTIVYVFLERDLQASGILE